MPATTTLTARLPTKVGADIRRFFAERGKGPSEGVRSILEEWWSRQRFRHIAFRDSPTGRRAILRTGPELWEVIGYWRDFEPDVAGLKDHFGAIDPEAIDEALAYYDAFPEGIDTLIAQNEQYERFLRERGDR